MAAIFELQAELTRQNIYCFIDESGTMPDQQLMVVALVMLEGQRSAERLHLKIVSKVSNPPRFEKHSFRFSIYKILLEAIIQMAFEASDDLAVSISKQGGWEIYGPPLLSKLRELPETLRGLGVFRKGNFFFASPAQHGQQIADFYASASWHFLTSDEDAADRLPFQLVEHQIKIIHVAMSVERP